MILNIESDEFIKKISDYVKKEKKDFWNELSPQDQAEIKKGIKQLEEGKRTSYNDILKKIS
ncbi:hypothetical protein JCM19301_3901 [Jejuia pallidilutea]|nr:hypothetical protein JCM19301_3901 [Jejuia pallidilutea]GAL89001.1 hypothetical protein JCM19538_1990 [Jejuia pallidilutea]